MSTSTDSPGAAPAPVVGSLTLSQVAERLGVPLARVQALVEARALSVLPGAPTSVPAAEVDALVERDTLRVVDLAAVEATVDRVVDRALRRRMPGLLDRSLGHLSGEVATAFADIEFSVQRLAAAETRADLAEARARAAEDALGAARTRTAVLEAQVAALQARPTGLFRRRRRTGTATA